MFEVCCGRIRVHRLGSLCESKQPQNIILLTKKQSFCNICEILNCILLLHRTVFKEYYFYQQNEEWTQILLKGSKNVQLRQITS